MRQAFSVLQCIKLTAGKTAPLAVRTVPYALMRDKKFIKEID
jgi:hypothetical protein